MNGVIQEHIRSKLKEEGGLAKLQEAVTTDRSILTQPDTRNSDEIRDSVGNKVYPFINHPVQIEEERLKALRLAKLRGNLHNISASGSKGAIGLKAGEENVSSNVSGQHAGNDDAGRISANPNKLGSVVIS